MNREQINDILAEAGIENNKALTSALLSAFNEDKRNAIVETTNKIMEDLKEYKSPDDVKKLQDEITSLKDANAKTIRTNSYKNSKVMDKWVEYVDAQYKKSAEEKKGLKFDEWLSSFVESNPELCERGNTNDTPTTPKAEASKDVKSNETKEIGNTQTSSSKPNAQPTSLREALAEHYGFNEQK